MISNNIMKLVPIRKMLRHHRQMGKSVFNLSRLFNNENMNCFRYSQCKFYSGSQASEKCSFEEENIKRFINNLMQEYKNLKNGDCKTENSFKRLGILDQLANQMKMVEEIQNEIVDLKQFIINESTESEMVAIAKDDISKCNTKLSHINNQILEHLIPPEEGDESDVIVEVTAGVGGQEAMLFAKDIFDMYNKYAEWKKWSVECMDVNSSDMAGIRQATMNIRGTEVYRTLKYEGGVHRVQRVPKTEKSGRVHTSTATVAIIPQPSEIDLQLHKEDLKIETKRSSGAGGQHVNTTDSAVRIIHLPTGLRVECQTERSQILNKKQAITKLRALLYQRQLDEQHRLHETSRKLQVGTSGRSEKIRTYNFNQDRVTDHRIGFTIHDLARILAGESELQQIIDQLQNFSRQEILQQIIENSLQQK